MFIESLANVTALFLSVFGIHTSKAQFTYYFTKQHFAFTMYFFVGIPLNIFVAIPLLILIIYRLSTRASELSCFQRFVISECGLNIFYAVLIVIQLMVGLTKKTIKTFVELFRRPLH